MKPCELDVVREFILEYICLENHLDDSPVGITINFIEQGLLDSFATLNLIMSLELKFDVKFSPLELANKEMRIVENLAQLVVQKQVANL